MSFDPRGPGHEAPLIPGAYERNTLTYPPPGSGGAATPVATPIGSSSMDAATIAEREREGGGAPSQRRRKAAEQARTGPAPGAPESKKSWLTRFVPDPAPRPSMSAVRPVSPEEDASAERWRLWLLRNQP